MARGGKPDVWGETPEPGRRRLLERPVREARVHPCLPRGIRGAPFAARGAPRVPHEATRHSDHAAGLAT